MFYFPEFYQTEDVALKIDQTSDGGHPAGRIVRVKTSLAFVSLVAVGLLSSCSSEKNGTATNSKPGGTTPPATDPVSKYGTPTPCVSCTTPAYGTVAATISYQIGGSVIDSSTNQPIANVTISFMNNSTTTDKSGAWQLTFAAVTDCAADKSCQVTVTPADLSSAVYSGLTQDLVDTDVSAASFVSLKNVIKLAANTTPMPAYAVTAVYASVAPNK